MGMRVLAVVATVCLSAFCMSGCADSSTSESTALTSAESIMSAEKGDSNDNNATGSGKGDASTKGRPDGGVEEYGDKVSEYASLLNDCVQRAYQASLEGNYKSIDGIMTEAEKASTALQSLEAPSGYEKVQSGYAGFAKDVEFSVSYLRALAVAIDSKDSDLADYYAGLAADAMEKVAAEMAEAARELDSLKGRNTNAPTGTSEQRFSSPEITFGFTVGDEYFEGNTVNIGVVVSNPNSDVSFSNCSLAITVICWQGRSLGSGCGRLSLMERFPNLWIWWSITLAQKKTRRNHSFRLNP